MWENRETAIWQAKFEIWIYNVFDRQFQLDYYLVSKCDKEYTCFMASKSSYVYVVLQYFYITDLRNNLQRISKKDITVDQEENLNNDGMMWILSYSFTQYFMALNFAGLYLEIRTKSVKRYLVCKIFHHV